MSLMSLSRMASEWGEATEEWLEVYSRANLYLRRVSFP